MVLQNLRLSICIVHGFLHGEIVALGLHLQCHILDTLERMDKGGEGKTRSNAWTKNSQLYPSVYINHLIMDFIVNNHGPEFYLEDNNSTIAKMITFLS